MTAEEAYNSGHRVVIKPPSTSLPMSPSSHTAELHSYPSLKKSLSGAGLGTRPLLPRKRSRSEAWIRPPKGTQCDSDVLTPKHPHCWQCGAALPLEMDSYQERPTPPLSASPGLRFISGRETVEVQAPQMSFSDHHNTFSRSYPRHPLSQDNKLMRMKDAMLDATDIPVIALWHDGSLAAENEAVAQIKYFGQSPVSAAAGPILSSYRVFTEDFDREFEQYDFPLVKLCRTQQPFSRIRIGLLDSKSRRRVYEILGRCIYDEQTGEFQAGVCALKDVTWYTELLKAQSEQNEQNEQQFQLICETLPQMVCRLSEQMPECSRERLTSNNSYGPLPQKDVKV